MHTLQECEGKTECKSLLFIPTAKLLWMSFSYLQYIKCNGHVLGIKTNFRDLRALTTGQCQETQDYKEDLSQTQREMIKLHCSFKHLSSESDTSLTSEDSWFMKVWTDIDKSYCTHLHCFI